MKRFYKIAEAGTAPGSEGVSHVVRLDGKLLKTPLKETLAVQSALLAQAIAREWQGQGDTLQPATMPLTQLANTMIDKSAGPERPALDAEICRFADSDLVCYLATHPPELVKRQEDVWLPLLDWLAQDKGITLTAIRGIRYETQPQAAVARLTAWVESLPPESFTAAQAVTGVTGSVVIALAICEGRIDADQAYAAACVDELFQLERWGEDKLARDRLEKIRFEIESCVQFLKLARGLVTTSVQAAG